MRIIASEADIQEGIDCLARIDARLLPVIGRAGPIPLRRHAPGFAGLCHVIVSQQLSVASANAIWAKTEAGLDVHDPAAFAGASEAALRACGLSAPKMRTLRALAAAALAETLPVNALHEMPVADAMASLTGVKGVGPWTAEIYLMFHAGHADAFPAGDLALQEAVRIAFGFDKRPDAKALAAQALLWQPWRAVAARLFWAYYRAVKTREGIT